MSKQSIIFLSSQSPRSGHNFVSQVIKYLGNAETAIENKSEIPLGAVLANFDNTLNSNYSSKGAANYLKEIFVKDVREKIIRLNKNVLIKYTLFSGAQVLCDYFPNDKHILLIRDPRDCIISQLKLTKLGKGFKGFLKRLTYPLGLYHFNYARKYCKNVERLKPNFNNFFIIKYESVVSKDQDFLNRLITFFNASVSLQDLSDFIDNVPVINTSFYKEETLSNDVWEPTKRTNKFQPIGRRKQLNKLQYSAINFATKKLRKQFEYL